MEKSGWCGPCHHRCGLKVTLEDGKAISVSGNKDHPVSRGFMCGRGKTILEQLYHKDRLDYPLKRASARGANDWKMISWDEALDEIAGRLGAIKEHYGSESLTFSHATYQTYGWPIKRFFHLDYLPVNKLPIIYPLI